MTKLREGHFKHRELRAKLPLDAHLLTDDKFEERVLCWARERFDEIVASGLLDHPRPGGKDREPTTSEPMETDEFEAES